MDWLDLQRAIAEWESYAKADRSDATRRVRQVAYLLQLEDQGQHRFLPMRHLIAWHQGVPFTQQGGRSIDIKDHYAALGEMGLARVGETSPFFEALWDRYIRHCADLGSAPANYIGDNARTGRVFWSLPA